MSKCSICMSKECCGGQMEETIAKLQSERDSLMNDMQRIYDNCSDTDLIIDIADAALEGNDE